MLDLGRLLVFHQSLHYCLINKGIISATDHTIANYSVPLCTKATGADVGLVPSIGQNTPSRPYHYRLHYCDL